MRTPNYLDCCVRPELNALRTLYKSSHDTEILTQCMACQTFWFYRFHEWEDWYGGNDDLTKWYSKLTTAEGLNLRDATDPSSQDLSFLRTRPSWMEDAQGAKRVDNAPDHPYR